jgi:hypothetical protein
VSARGCAYGWWFDRLEAPAEQQQRASDRSSWLPGLGSAVLQRTMLGGAFLRATHASSRPFSSSALLAVAAFAAPASHLTLSAVLKGAKRLVVRGVAAPARGPWSCSCCMLMQELINGL